MQSIAQHPHKSTTHQELYFHANGPVVVKSQEGRSRMINGFTVFARRVDPGFDKEPGFWAYTVAVCSEHDAFCKKVGRHAARRRFFDEGHFPVSGDTDKIPRPTASVLAAVGNNMLPVVALNSEHFSEEPKALYKEAVKL